LLLIDTLVCPGAGTQPWVSDHVVDILRSGVILWTKKMAVPKHASMPKRS
jgi:hypothetical protein